ncbi:lysozyme inhibitor LprI family protein [Labrys sp. WJW]|uniref:lysozyme inhibitor LprI family protein n=1 Tax=Labrys sp. WJW TaxID=1737983 RepID=UPI000B048593|nr:lysozyme inhibitor LprI family protein [Labrys sp. WJW]
MRLPGLIRTTLMGLAVVSAAGPAFAAGDCANAADEAALNQCAGKSLKASDGELNTLYKQIQKRLNDDADKTKLLVAAQRAWVAFRDAECNFSSAGVTGGTLYPLAVTQCRDGLTKDRIKTFKTYLNCTEGDLSCSVPAAN